MRAIRERVSGAGTRSLSLSKCRVHILNERDGNDASKDIAESPTALPERPENKDTETLRLQGTKVVSF